MESFNTQPPVIPFDIIALIIDTVGENEDIDLLKELALVSHSFLQICNKHLFATIDLHDAAPRRQRASSKKGFVKLLRSRPDVVKYIRKLTYTMSGIARLRSVKEDRLLSSILPNFLKTIPQLDCLVINALGSDWNTREPSLISALLHLMHLPTMNHIYLAFIKNFPLSSLAPCVNLHELDLLYMETKNGFPEIIQSEMPRIRRLSTSQSSRLTRNFLHAKRRDGQPALDLTDLKQLQMSFGHPEDGHNIQYLLQNAKLLDKLNLSCERDGLTLEGLHDILSPVSRTLKTLELSMTLYHDDDPPLGGLCDELEAMAGHNVLEVLAFQLNIVNHETADFIGSRIEMVDKVLVKPGWSALKQVSVDISIAYCPPSREFSAVVLMEALQPLKEFGEVKLMEAVQPLPDKYLSHLSKLESVTLNFSTWVVDLSRVL